MSIYMKALELQAKTADLYADSILANNLEAYETSKKTLETAFKTIAALPNHADLVLLANVVQPPSEKSAKKYRQWLSEIHDSPENHIMSRMKEIQKDKFIKLSMNALQASMNLVLAENQCTTSRQNLSYFPAFEKYRIAKKDLKAAVKTALEGGMTKEQLISSIKEDAYRARNMNLNYRTLDKVESWAQKHQK